LVFTELEIASPSTLQAIALAMASASIHVPRLDSLRVPCSSCARFPSGFLSWGCSKTPLRRHRLAASTPGFPLRLMRDQSHEIVPSLSFLPTSTAFSASRFAGLLQPAASHGVRVVSIHRSSPNDVLLAALYPSELSLSPLLHRVTATPSPPRRSIASRRSRELRYEPPTSRACSLAKVPCAIPTWPSDCARCSLGLFLSSPRVAPCAIVERSLGSRDPVSRFPIQTWFPRSHRTTCVRWLAFRFRGRAREAGSRQRPPVKAASR